MAKFIDFNGSNCKGCYKCLKYCSTKAIKFVNHQAYVIELKCILCGKCILVCPQKAKSAHSDRDKVKEMFAKSKVIASVAPSFIANYPIKDSVSLKIALVKLGFDEVYETSDGANLVNEEYIRLLKQGTYKNFITSCCPAVNKYIEEYAPEALPYLAPVITPMEANARMIKEMHPDAKVVFIGPCIAKKEEASRDTSMVDAVLSFEDMNEMLQEANISLEKIAELPLTTTPEAKITRLYPIPNGIVDSILHQTEYQYMSLDGIEKCKEVLAHIEDFDHVFFEMNSCEFGCVNGPSSNQTISCAAKLLKVKEYAKLGTETYQPKNDFKFSMTESFHKIPNDLQIPMESEIKAILHSIGKYSEKDELNCGACGYNSCREKAIAIYNNLADPEMCLPYMRERAELMSSEIISNMPIGIIVMDNDMNIVDLNDAAKVIYGIDEDIRGRFAYDFLDTTDFLTAYSTGTNVYNKKVEVKKTNKIIKLSTVYLSKKNIFFAIAEDITEMERQNKRMTDIELESLNTTDEVIKKLMYVAQEVASLLGESVSETKSNLLKLKKVFMDDMERKKDE